ncbi:MAG: TrkH family potassium uptake protein [Clostridia bacterium]|nr:TrkH family potassium uptake protein [Clostridia bacterium]
MILKETLKIKYKLLVHYSGLILIISGLIMLIPLIVLPFYKNETNHMISFILPSLLSMLTGYFLWQITRTAKSTVELTIRDGGIIVVFGWIMTCIISSIPFILSKQLNFTQAMFESVSGWTTTGLSVVDVTVTPHIFLIWRSIMQFFGGAGIAVIMLAAIIGPAGTGLYSAEGRTDMLLPNITKSTKMIMSIYLGYTISGIILYIIAGMPVFDSFVHSLSALSTGGFSSVPNSIGEYQNIYIEMITIILMLLGTINFAAHYLLLKGNFKRFIRLGEVKFMFFIMSIFIPAIFFFSIKPLYSSIGKSLRIAVFEVTSALSTTGFSTVSYTTLNDFAIYVIILLMLIGGGTGSTAGGIKQFRVYVLIKSFVDNVRGFLLSPKRTNEIMVMKPDGKTFLNNNQIVNIGNFVFIYIFFYIFGVGTMMIFGFPFMDSMFEFASTIGTVGLSIGITSATAPPFVLWVQIIGMLLGRLEILVVFYAIIKIFKDFRAIAGRHTKNK